jgi:predicted SAM-dependent methyltransferase
MKALTIMKTMTKNLLRRQGLQVSRIDQSKRTQQGVTVAKVTGLLRTASQINLELGAGPVKGKNGWMTVDQYDGADLIWDLTMPLPFPDKTVAKIYSSHLLEHFSYRDLMRLLIDCHRVLKISGSFSACVPDASLWVRAYLQRETLDRSFLAYDPAVISNCKMDWLNYIAYMDGEHHYMFDKENLVRVLIEAGFSEVKIRDFDPTLDLPERNHNSIYACAKKCAQSVSPAKFPR